MNSIVKLPAPTGLMLGALPKRPLAVKALNALAATRAKTLSPQASLNLKGVSEPVDVPFLWRQDAENPGRAIMSGQLTLQRSDFSIGIGDWSSGEQIGIDVSVSFVLFKCSGRLRS